MVATLQMRHKTQCHLLGPPTVAGLIAITPIASAQTYPSKAMRMVAGMAAGGGADANARRLAQILGKIVKQNVIVDNVSGGAGNLAAQAVAGAGGDGHTLL